MAISYSADMKGYAVNEYLQTKVGGKILVTAKHGGWALLSEEEYGHFRTGRVQQYPGLYNLLEQQGLIISENNARGIAEFYRNKYHQVFSGTTLHIITPTLRCNQKCIYCYASSKPEGAKEYDMGKGTAKKVLDFIFQCPSTEIAIEFQGGEPLLNFPVVKYIIENGSRMGKKTGKRVSFRLVSNLTKMDRQKLAYLVKRGVEINTSLDGPERIHDQNRKYDNGKGTYADVVKWLDFFNKKKIQYSCMPTITRHSLPHWKEIIDEYVRLGLGRFWVRKQNIGGFAASTWKTAGYTPEEFLGFWKKCLEYIFELNRKGIRIEEGNITLILGNILRSKQFNSFLCMASPCGCAWGQASYNYKGEVYSCDEARSFDVFRIGNTKESSYKEVYSSSRALDTVALTTGESFNCAACAYHPFCGPCIVDNYGESGNIIQKPDSYNCAVKKGMLDYIFGEIIPDKEKFGIAACWLGLKA